MMEKNDNSDMCNEDQKRIQLKLFEIEERRKNLTDKESKNLKRRQNIENKTQTVNKEIEDLQIEMENFD